MSREACRVAPPSGLRVNPKSAVPVHAQLMTQIRHFISTGTLKPGTQLPTVRQLAGFLRINPSTVARPLADLEREGFIEAHQGRGTYVTGRPPREGHAARSLERLVGESLERARRLGFTAEEFLAALASSQPAGRASKAVRHRALLVEASIKTLLRLTELPEGTTVGLVCASAAGGQNLLRSVQSAGLMHITPVLASTDDPWSIDRML